MKKVIISMMKAYRNDFDDAEVNSIKIIPMNVMIIICLFKIMILLYLLTMLSILAVQ